MASKLHISRIFSILIIIAMFVGMGGAARSLASPTTPNALSSPVVVRLYVTDVDNLNEVAGDLDIWESHPEDQFVVALVKPEQYQWLQNLGYRMEIDTEKTEMLSNPAAVLDPRYAYFDDFNPNTLNNYMLDFMTQTNTDYPNLVEMIDIGDAWAGLHMGYQRDIWVLRITNEDPVYGAIEDKPVFYLHGGIHAREVTIPELLIRYVKYLTTGYNGLGGYGIDPDVTWMVNHQTVYVLITSNPDGHVINEMNVYYPGWRKNVDSDDGCSSSSSWGVDLNRNHSFKWGCCGGSSGDPCSDTYRGPLRASEPETIALQNHVASVIADQNGPNGDDELPPAAPENTTGLFLSMHSYSNLTLFPWGATNTLPDPPNLAQLSTLGHKFANYTGYTTFSIWYDTDGGSVDWAYGKLGIASYTFEVGPQDGNCGGFFPSYDCIEGANGASENFWAENRPAFIYAHKIANTPYMTSYGPDAQNLAVTPSSVPQGEPVTLTANLRDHRCCGDPLGPIAGAEYFLDAPGADGTGIAMSPVDGNWGGTEENGTATVDTSSLAPGQHYILVHARNNAGKWGPFTAVFVDTTASEAPVAGFIFAPDPPHAGETILFTDTSTASPTEFFWDFGDGATSTIEDPTHVFSSTGTFIVTHIVTNTLGSDGVTQSLQVLPVDAASVDLTLGTPAPINPGDLVAFDALIAPPDAAPPFNYSINYGDGTVITDTVSVVNFPLLHAYASGGTFTVTLKVWNNSMTPEGAVSDTLVVLINPQYRLYLPIVTK